MLTLGLLALTAAYAAPQEPTDGAEGYALIIGSNQPGPGQEPLQHAGDDALRMEAVLAELGDTDRIEMLLDPDAAEVLGALDDVEAALARRSARGEQSLFIFYYSGHARAQALDLGDDALALDDLRARLDAMASTVTLVVLDACQAGALTQVKGVSPAADFSTNSVSRLNTEGMAVMASSSATELSQESAALGGSFFTHHLVTGLRGAADGDADGSVTLDEVYRYAYHRTLVDTSVTAVGSQHVTLETDLRGRGEMTLSRPGDASASLWLPAELAGEALVFHADSELVVAEVHKAAGEEMNLALLPGSYGATVRQGERAFRCALTLEEGERTHLDLTRCDAVVAEAVTAKGPMDPRVEHWMVELTLGMMGIQDDAYTETLTNFSFEEPIQLFMPSVSAWLAWTPRPYVSLLAGIGGLDSRGYAREMRALDDSIHEQRFSWYTARAGLAARASYPIWRARIVPYAQVGAGPAWGTTSFKDEDISDDEQHWGPWIGAAGGVQLMAGPRWRHFGVFAQAEAVTAPVINNLFDETHDSGGPIVSMGLRGGY